MKTPAAGGKKGEYDANIAFGLLRALRNTAVSVVYQDKDLRVIWAQNVPLSWAAGRIIGKTDSEFLPGEAASLVVAAKHSLLEGALPGRLEIQVPAIQGHREEQWFNLWIDADMAQDGSIQGIVTTAVDTTEQKRRENTLRVLLREVSHRSRNLLAIIQSIATQTGRNAATIDRFLLRFRGRLQSLASSQDLITSSDWRGADLGELVQEQVSRYSSTAADAVTLEGERAWLSPNAALHVGLALHELIANSTSHGALSHADGHVRLFAEMKEDANRDFCLSLTWLEKLDSLDSAQKDAAPVMDKKHFASMTLERVVPASIDGTASLTMRSDMLEYRLNIPPGHFEIS